MVKLPFFNRSKDPIGDFWEYFAEAAPTIAKAGRPANTYVEGISQKLSRISRDLAWQIGAGEGECSLEISGEGVREMIPLVQSVVGAAPVIPGWKIFAFRQRMGEPGAITLNGMVFDPDKVFFESLITDSCLDLALFVDGLNPQNREAWIGALFLLLDASVGEYEVMTKIGGIDFFPLEQAADRTQLRAFNQLASVVDAI